MSGNSIEIEVDADDARDAVESWQRVVGRGGREAVDQITVTAERHMKREAPEGVGHPDVNMRTTIKTTTESRDPYRKVVMPRKRTDEGWLLHRAIVGNPSTPDYDIDPDAAYPPNVPIWVDGGEAAGPVAEWAEAKMGDRSAAWALGWQWALGDGQESFPNEFIDRSIAAWESQTERIAQDAVESAFRGGA